MLYGQHKLQMPSPEQALPGRDTPMQVSKVHFVTGAPTQPPFPEGLETAQFALGCFWGAERLFWQTDGVFSTAVGYAGGFTPHPTYDEVCSGQTGHTEAVLVVFDPQKIPYRTLLEIFWQSHDPTQGMRQGNDVGTQYRSAIHTFGKTQAAEAGQSKDLFQNALSAAGRGTIGTEIVPAPTFYYAEDFHQQYLGKNPHGYCGLGGIGVKFPGWPVKA